MEIFQKSVISKHLATLDKDQIEKAYQKFKENYSLAKIEKIRQRTNPNFNWNFKSYLNGYQYFIDFVVFC